MKLPAACTWNKKRKQCTRPREGAGWQVHRPAWAQRRHQPATARRSRARLRSCVVAVQWTLQRVHLCRMRLYKPVQGTHLRASGCDKHLLAASRSCDTTSLLYQPYVFLHCARGHFRRAGVRNDHVAVNMAIDQGSRVNHV